MRAIAVSLALAGALAACGSGAAPAPAPERPPSISIKLFAFDPPAIAVAAGATITWTNQDQILHTVTAGTPDEPEPERFDGQLDDVGSSFSFTFDDPGAFAYFCTRHPTAMTGIVTVE